MSRRRNTGPGISFFAFQDIITAVVGIFILVTLILVLQLAQRVEAASEAVPQDIQPIMETVASLQEQISGMEAEIATRAEAGAAMEGINAFNIVEQVEQLKSENAGLQARIETSRGKQQELKKLSNETRVIAQTLAEQAASQAGQRERMEELSDKIDEIQSQRIAMTDDPSTVFRDQTERGKYVVLVSISDRSMVIRDALTQSVTELTGPTQVEQWRRWLRDIPLSRRHLLLRIQPGGERDFQSIRTAADEANAQYGYTVVGADDQAKFGHELRVVR